MRSLSLSLLLLASLWALVSAWTKEDHEIFRLKDEIDQNEGQGSTFYDFLQISRSATQSEVNKAYRKRSRTLHPDKAKQSLIAARAAAKPTSKPGSKPTAHVNKPPTAREIRAAEKEASERFTRLGLVTEILRGEGRERYNHFLDNGFPAWRGTGFYYARFRPGIGSVLVGLFIFGGGLVHYIVLILGYKRQRDFVGRYIRQAQKAAWGDEGKTSILRNVRGLGGKDEEEKEGATVIDEDYDLPDAPRNRRERRQQDRETRQKKKKSKGRERSVSADPRGTATPSEAGGEGLAPAAAGNVTPAPGPKKQVEAENGKVLVVDSEGKVFLEEEDEESGESQLFLLDPEEIERPSFKQTVLWRLPVWVAGLVRERVKGTNAESGEKGSKHVKENAVEEGSEEDSMGDVIVVSKEEGLNGGKASVNGNVDVGENGNGKKGNGKKRKGKK